MIPDALKPAICERCDGKGRTDCPAICADYTHLPPPAHACRVCGGSGLNPDKIRHDVRIRGTADNRYIHVGKGSPGRYVVIPLEETT